MTAPSPISQGREPPATDDPEPADPSGVGGRFADAMARLLGRAPGGPPRALGLAVSGGGDSTALMHLAVRWAGGAVALHVLTVDHGLREASRAEAEAVGRQAGALGLPHEVAPWRWDGAGNLQAAAREGRRRLLRDWARARSLPAVLLGHTRDDQAETLLMRLARGSGVEGLSGMEEGAWGGAGEVAFLRPLLAASRADLRGWLRAHGLAWIEDPSNADARFERVRARRAIEALGLDAGRLAATAGRMARARQALELRAHEVAARLLRPAPEGDLRLERDGLLDTDADTRLRIVAGALRCVSGAPYRPREADLERAVAGALDGRARTLHGCVVRPEGGMLLIHREAEAVASLRAPAGGPPWDGAWTLEGEGVAGCEVAALGEAGLRRIGAAGGAQAGAGPRAALAAKPALWRGEALLGFAPVGFGLPHRSIWRPRGGAFPGCLLSGAAPEARAGGRAP